MGSVLGAVLARTMPRRFPLLDQAVVALRLSAQAGMFRGTETLAEAIYIASCRGVVTLYDPTPLILFTRDCGMHSSGWWKNPDYERCYHLSLSFHDAATGEPAPFRQDRARTIAEAFFRDDAAKLWMEPPTEDGVGESTHHFRLFCDEGWQGIIPRGEVYSTEATEAGWKSWSDVQAAAAAERLAEAERMDRPAPRSAPAGETDDWVQVVRGEKAAG